MAIALAIILAVSGHASPRWTHFTNSNAIVAMADDGRHLWLGAEGGLIRIRKAAAETTYFNVANSALTDVSIRSLAANRQGWMGAVTTQGGLAVFDGQNWTTLNTHNALMGQYAIDLAWGSDGMLWVLAVDGQTRLPSLFRWHNKVWTRHYLDIAYSLYPNGRWGYGYSVYQPFPLHRPWLQSDSKGRVWVFVLKNAMLPKVFRLDARGVIDTVVVPHHLMPYQMVVSDTGRVTWICREGLARPHATGWDITRLPEVEYGYSFGLRNHPRNLFAHDHEGAELWALDDAWVYRLGNQGWDSLFHQDLPNHLAPVLLASVDQGQNPTLFLSDGSRVGALKGSVWNAVDVAKNVLDISPEGAITSLSKDMPFPADLGNLSVTYPYIKPSLTDLFTKSGCIAFDSLPPHNFSSSQIEDIRCDKQGQLWVLFEKALWVWNGTVWYEQSPGMETGFSLHIAALAVDSEGILWAATAHPDASLFRWNKDWGWQKVAETEGKFSTTEVHNMVFDGLGQLWMTTYPAGVLVFNPNGTAPILRTLTFQKRGGQTKPLRNLRLTHPQSNRTFDLNGRQYRSHQIPANK